MPENPHYGEEIVNPETHHETSDVNVRALIWFVVICVVFGFVAHFVLKFLFDTYVKLEKHRNTNQMTDIQRTPEMTVPQNQPLLQPFPHEIGKTVQPPYESTPVTDLARMRASEDRVLHNYGWVDRQRGIVRVPIDVAMRLTVERGLPVQNTPPTGAHP